MSDADEMAVDDTFDDDDDDDEFDDDFNASDGSDDEDEDDDDDEIDGNRRDVNELAAANATGVLDYIVRELVDNPDEVRVEVDESGRRIALNVYVADGDMGRVIGKRGRVAQSIRRVVRAAAVKDGVEVDIEFVD